MAAIRVLIVDDHPVVREGLRGMLTGEPDIEVAGEAGSGNEAVARAAAESYDVFLVDLRMPDGDGVSAIAGIRRCQPDAGVIVLTTYQSDRDILRAVEAGATGYLLKDASRADLVAAIRSAARGESAMSPAVATRLMNRMREPAGGSLSPRETQVLGLVARGLTNAEVGERLFISEATVKTHLLRIFGKLGVSDRTAAVTRALDRDLLPPR